MQEEIKYLLDTNPIKDKTFDFNPLYNSKDRVKHFFQTPTIDVHNFKNLNLVLSPADLLEDLLHNTTNNSQTICQILNEFTNITEEDILDCVLVMSKNIQGVEDLKQRTINQVFNSVKSSN